MRPSESFLAQPVRSLQTMLRVIAQEDPVIPAVIPDGIYGPSTMIAVTAFQRREGIPVTGVADQVTWEALVEAYEDSYTRIGKAEPIEILLEPGGVLRPGDTSPYVYLAQSILIQLSQTHLVIPGLQHNGVLDSSTQRALKAFQGLAGIPQTGLLDRITWMHLSRQFTLHAAFLAGKERSRIV